MVASGKLIFVKIRVEFFEVIDLDVSAQTLRRNRDGTQ